MAWAKAFWVRRLRACVIKGESEDGGARHAEGRICLDGEGGIWVCLFVSVSVCVTTYRYAARPSTINKYIQVYIYTHNQATHLLLPPQVAVVEGGEVALGQPFGREGQRRWRWR